MLIPFTVIAICRNVWRDVQHFWNHIPYYDTIFWYHLIILYYDTILWYHLMIPYYDTILWYHIMIPYYATILWYHVPCWPDSLCHIDLVQCAAVPRRLLKDWGIHVDSVELTENHQAFSPFQVGPRVLLRCDGSWCNRFCSAVTFSRCNRVVSLWRFAM